MCAHYKIMFLNNTMAHPQLSIKKKKKKIKSNTVIVLRIQLILGYNIL